MCLYVNVGGHLKHDESLALSLWKASNGHCTFPQFSAVSRRFDTRRLETCSMILRARPCEHSKKNERITTHSTRQNKTRTCIEKIKGTFAIVSRFLVVRFFLYTLSKSINCNIYLLFAVCFTAIAHQPRFGYVRDSLFRIVSIRFLS